jgi:predicted Fe-Mo cluster-binding NifX family protein
LPKRTKKISEHFGHAESFLIVEVVDQKIVHQTTIVNPDLEHGSLPKYLMDLGIDQIVCGGIGAGAIERFFDKGSTAH